MEHVKKLLHRYGWFGIVRVLFYPVTVLLTTPIRLIQSLWSCRVLIDGRWGDYNRFNPHHGLNSLHYWSIAIQLYRFGRTGKCSYSGLGDYPMVRYFFMNLLSLYLYWRASNVTVLAGIALWWMGHMACIPDCSLSWGLITLLLLLISTSLYSNLFILQNYNVVGWVFFPIGVYGLMSGKWSLAALAWVGASFGSVTVVFIAGLLSLAVAGINFSLYPLIAFLPATIKMLTHLWPLFRDRELKRSLNSVVKAIGMKAKNVKYKRKRAFSILHLFYIILCLQFIVAFYLIFNQIPALICAALAIYLVNQIILRFADEQSLRMMMVTIATLLVMHNHNYMILPFYWLLISPLPYFCGFTSVPDVLDIVPRVAPFYVKPLIEGMEKFLAPVPSGKRIFMAFDDPDGDYKKLFDRYRVLPEIIIFCGIKKEIHILPNWRAIFEMNYEGAPDFWGRDVESVFKNIMQWKADYVVVYQQSRTTLETKWVEAGFQTLEKFDWGDYDDVMRGQKPFGMEPPCWWLLKVPPEHVNELRQLNDNNSRNDHGDGKATVT